MSPAPAAGFRIERWTDAAPPDGLTALIDEADRAGHLWMRDFNKEWRARPFMRDGEALFVAFAGTRPVGMAVISADPHVADRETGRLRYIFVAAEARRRGLLRAFVALCLARGAHWGRPRPHTDNPVAARVYEVYGFLAVADQTRSTRVRPGGYPAAEAGGSAS